MTPLAGVREQPAGVLTERVEAENNLPPGSQRLVQFSRPGGSPGPRSPCRKSPLSGVDKLIKKGAKAWSWGGRLARPDMLRQGLLSFLNQGIVLSEATTKAIKKAVKLVHAARKIVAFTGAGVSTESGIPDFRSPGGIWEKYKPVYYEDFLKNESARKNYWKRSKATYPVIKDAQPNPTHLALTELERMGKLDCIITQNIDRLHHKAGNSPENIIEIHGNVAHVICLSCNKTFPREEIQSLLEKGTEIPRCPECGGLLKDATISFGQPMPEKEIAEAQRRAQSCDLMLALGSSLVVYPAAYLPQYARHAGAKLIIINMTPTKFDHLADVVIHSKTGEVLPLIVEEVKKLSAREISE